MARTVTTAEGVRIVVPECLDEIHPKALGLFDTDKHHHIDGALRVAYTHVVSTERPILTTWDHVVAAMSAIDHYTAQGRKHDPLVATLTEALDAHIDNGTHLYLVGRILIHIHFKQMDDLEAFVRSDLVPFFEHTGGDIDGEEAKLLQLLTAYKNDSPEYSARYLRYTLDCGTAGIPSPATVDRARKLIRHVADKVYNDINNDISSKQ